MSTDGLPITRERIWTFFVGDTFHYNDMETSRRLDVPARKVECLGLGWNRVDRACVDPLDRDHVWFFRGDEVIEYDNSRHRVSAPYKLKDHPIFGALPAALHGGRFDLVLDPREFGLVEDARKLALELLDGDSHGSPAPSPLVRSSQGSVEVRISDADRNILLGNVLRLTRGQTLAIKHEFKFEKAGTFDLGAIVQQGSVKVGFAKDDSPPTPTLKLKQESGSTATVNVQFTLLNDGKDVATVGILANSGAALKLHYEVIQAPVAKGRLPLLYVFSQSTAYLLWLTSTQSAVVIREGITRRWGTGETKTYINGGGDRWDSVIQLKDCTEKDKLPPQMDLGDTITTTFFETRLSSWLESSVPDIALPSHLKTDNRVVVPAPGGGKIVSRAPVPQRNPPETVIGIPGRRDPALDTTMRQWFADLPTCNQPATGESRTKRTQAFIARMASAGDLPNFLRTFVPVWVKEFVTIGGTPVRYQVIYYVMPDFLSVGNETNFIRIPLCASGGQKVAEHYGCLQPTGKMAFQILKQTSNRMIRHDTQLIKYHHFDPNAREGAPSTPYFVRQNALIERDRLQSGFVLGRLTAGHKKEIVIDARMHKEHNPVTGEGRGLPVMFWGGMLSMPHLTDDGRRIHVAHPVDRNGRPTTRNEDDADLLNSDACHHNNHDEYAQGQRLVHPKCWVRKEVDTWAETEVRTLLLDPVLHVLLSRSRFGGESELKYPGKVRLNDPAFAPWR